MYTVDIFLKYIIVLYLFNFKTQGSVFWKSFEEYLNIFHLRSHSLNWVQKN